MPQSRAFVLRRTNPPHTIVRKSPADVLMIGNGGVARQSQLLRAKGNQSSPLAGPPASR